MRDRKMCVTEKAFQIPVCPSTRLGMHPPLDTALADPRDADVEGASGDILVCWFMYQLAISIFTHSKWFLRLSLRTKMRGFILFAGFAGWISY